MSPKFDRDYLKDGSFIEVSIDIIEPDIWRPHGVRYRMAWVQEDECRLLFDNHHGKGDHYHIGEVEILYQFRGIEQLELDFYAEIKKLGGVR